MAPCELSVLGKDDVKGFFLKYELVDMSGMSDVEKAHVVGQQSRV